MENSKILIIGGPTGSGESTITKEIIKRYPNFQKLVSATSRSMRSGEMKNDYYFFPKKKFEQEIEKGNIIEYTYAKSRNVYYGTYKPELEKKLKKGFVIANVDFVGVEYFKNKYGAKAIFIKPKSLASIKKRLIKRNPEITNQELKLRLKDAAREIKNEEHFYDFVVINEDGKLEEAMLRIEEILKKNAYLS